MSELPVVIREYCPKDELGWLRCRVLAFLDTAYFDDVYQNKEQYESQSIELVACFEDQIVGLLDIESEDKPNTICSRSSLESPHPAGMIWHLAVHPDFRRKGIANKLLEMAKGIAQGMGIERFEAWTRDDEWVESWYKNQGFQRVQSYYHVYMDSDELASQGVAHENPRMKILSTFAHYTDSDQSFLNKFKRVHKCSRYDLIL